MYETLHFTVFNLYYCNLFDCAFPFFSLCRTAVAPEIASNLAKLMDSVKKIFALIKNAKSPLKVTRNFVTKGMKVVKKINASGLARGMSLVTTVLYMKQSICAVPVLLACICLLFVVFERKAMFSPTVEAFGLALIVGACVTLLFTLYLFEWMFMRTFNLGILEVTFTKDVGLVWAQLGYELTLAGAISYCICVFVGPAQDGVNESTFVRGDVAILSDSFE